MKTADTLAWLAVAWAISGGIICAWFGVADRSLLVAGVGIVGSGAILASAVLFFQRHTIAAAVLPIIPVLLIAPIGGLAAFFLPALILIFFAAVLAPKRYGDNVTGGHA